MSSAIFWKSPPWRHLIAVPQVTVPHDWSTDSKTPVAVGCPCAREQTAGTRWLIAEVNGRSSTGSSQTDKPEPIHDTKALEDQNGCLECMCVCWARQWAEPAEPIETSFGSRLPWAPKRRTRRECISTPPGKYDGIIGAAVMPAVATITAATC